MIRIRLIGVLAPTLALLGCATPGVSESALADLRNRLTDSQRKEAEGRRRVEELENRVFLLTDQVESYKVATQRTRSPRLPIVTLRPAEEEPAGLGGLGSDEAREDEQPAPVRPPERGHARVTLRGDGSHGTSTVEEARPRPRREASHAPTPEVRLASHTGGDNLGVAPVPPIPRGGAAPSSASPPKAPPPLALAERSALDQEPLSQYRAAYGELSAGRYEQAEQKLRAFVARFPKHDYADNAQYWLGESLYARQLFREAAVEFRATVAKYPVGNKAPDALLKLAYSLLSLNEAQEARRLLAELPTSYPRSEASRLAAQKLAELSPSQKPVPETGEAPR